VLAPDDFMPGREYRRPADARADAMAEAVKIKAMFKTLAARQRAAKKAKEARDG
jgi:hypothetical protein